LPVLETKAGIAGGPKTEKRIGPMPDGKNFLSMECAHGVRFSIRRFCETIACSMPEAQKPLVQLRIWHLMHADARHSQAGLARNCAMRITIDLFVGRDRWRQRN
jgi:hypothetical protein